MCQAACWAMFYARDPALLSAIHCGDAFLTELEGEELMRPYGEHFDNA